MNRLLIAYNMNWFECKISYDKMQETGAIKKVTESYLVEALSFTEAEAQIVEEMKPYISGGFDVTGIKQQRFAECFFNESGDRYYKIKVLFITLDEKSGTEKMTASQILTQASDIKAAIAILERGMKGTLADYVIYSISETLIMDVFITPAF